MGVDETVGTVDSPHEQQRDLELRDVRFISVSQRFIQLSSDTSHRHTRTIRTRFAQESMLDNVRYVHP